jgi:hypothetical protein
MAGPWAPRRVNRSDVHEAALRVPGNEYEAKGAIVLRAPTFGRTLIQGISQHFP